MGDAGTKKALIYNPYFDTLGGGERYSLSLAECLLAQGWQVDLFWDKKDIVDQSAKRFGLKIEKIGIVGKKAEELSFWERFKLTRVYDLIFWVSDGSIPFLFGRKNLLHFQVPLTKISEPKWWAKLKLFFISEVVVNSRFTKGFIDRSLDVDSVVLYPPVDIEKLQPGEKENIILAVGRFEETMQAKKQDVLIKAFKKMVDQGLSGWRLILIGGSLTEEKENSLLNRLKRLAKDYPISFLANLSFEALRQYYAKAKIFWHSAGFGVEEKREPWRVEHFGITTVEAMAAGCVPVVIDKGGLKEIVRRGAGERWGSVAELREKTRRLIKDEKRLSQLRAKAIASSKRFSKSKFNRRLSLIIKNRG